MGETLFKSTSDIKNVDWRNKGMEVLMNAKGKIYKNIYKLLDCIILYEETQRLTVAQIFRGL